MLHVMSVLHEEHDDNLPQDGRSGSKACVGRVHVAVPSLF